MYLDSILVYSKTTKHEKYLQRVFSWLHTYKLQEKYKKFEFGCVSIYYLGHIVGSNKI